MPRRADLDPKGVITPLKISLERSLVEARRNQDFAWLQQPVNYQLVMEALILRHPPRLARYLLSILEAFSARERDEPEDLSLEKRYQRYEDLLLALKKAKTPKTEHDLRVLHHQRSMLLVCMAQKDFPLGRCSMRKKEEWVSKHAKLLDYLARELRCYCGKYPTPTLEEWLEPRLRDWLPDWTEASYLGQIGLTHAILASLHGTTPAQIEKLLSRRLPSAPF